MLAVFLVLTDPGGMAQPVGSIADLPDAPLASLPQSSSAVQAETPSTQALAPVAQSPASSQDQLKKQEQQRVFGVMAAFNTTSNRDALPLTTGQKYQLFFKSATDPWPFVLTAFSAGIDQAENSFEEYGQGAQGYAKRFGASYTDYFTGNLLGNAVLAGLFKEDPRYFQKGTGSFAARAGWAATSTVWCKRDNGTWGPNYANVLGNLLGAAVSNFYYPQADRTVSGTVERGFSVTGEAIVGSEVIEFWPDLVRHHKRKAAEKLARQQALSAAAEPTPASPKP